MPITDKLAEAQRLMVSLDAIFQSRKYQEGVPVAERALTIFQQELGEQSADTALAYHQLAALHFQSGAFEESLKLNEKSLAIRRKVLGNGHAHTVRSLRNLANSLARLRQYEPAIVYQKEALAICESLYGEKHVDVASCSMSVGILFLQRKDYPPAREYLQRAVNVFKEVLGNDAAETVQAMRVLGDAQVGAFATADGSTALATMEAMIRAERYADAVPYAQQAVKITRAKLGQDHVDTAFALHQLGYLYLKTGAYELSRQSNVEALAIRRRVLGNSHEYTALSLQNLAAALSRLDKIDEAVACYKESLEIYEVALGPDNRTVAHVARQIGILLVNRGDREAARPYHARAVAIFEKELGKDHEQTIKAQRSLSLAAAPQSRRSTASRVATKPASEIVGDDALNRADVIVHLDAGNSVFRLHDYAGARKQFETALAQCDLHHQKPVTAMYLYERLAAAATKERDSTAARKYRQSAIAACEKVHGTNSRATVDAYQGAAANYAELGDLGAARAALERGLEINGKVAGSMHASNVFLHTDLAAMLARIGDDAAASKHFAEAVTVDRIALTDEDPDSAYLHYELGQFLGRLGQSAAARDHLERALHIRRKLYGEHRLDTASALGALGGLCLVMRDHTAAQNYFEAQLKILDKWYPNRGLDHLYVHNDLGFVRGCQGDYAAALAHFRQGLATARKTIKDDDPRLGPTYGMLSLFSAATGDWNAAAEAADQSRKRARRQLAAGLATLSDREQISYLANNDASAFHSALALALKLPHDAASASLSAGWVLNGKGIAQEVTAQRVLATRGNRDPAVRATLQELGQIRSQEAQMAFASAKRMSPRDRAKAFAGLTQSEDKLSLQLAQSGTASPLLGTWVEIEQVRKNLAPREVFVDIARCATLSFDFKTDGFNWAPHRYGAWIIPASGQGDVQLLDLGDADEIDKAVVALRVAINTIYQADPETGAIKPVDGRAVQLSERAFARLSKLILHPLEKRFSGQDQLIVSPDSALWLVPWAALVLPDGRFAVEKYQFSFVVSGRELAATPTKRGDRSPLIVANPDFDLPAAKAAAVARGVLNGEKIAAPSRATEVRLKPPTPALGLPLKQFAQQVKQVAPQLEKYAGKRPTIFQGDRALEPIVKAVHGPRIVLLATHGFFNPEMGSTTPAIDARLSGSGSAAPADAAISINPLLRCGLLLAGCNWRSSASGDDGILTGMEILDIDLRGTELVVLSACDTGVGDVPTGEGVAGIRQAFQLAGAETVVSTLWPVLVDEANVQMNDFFGQLAAGRTKAEALRQAQLASIARLKKKYQVAPPLVWATFTITGRSQETKR